MLGNKCLVVSQLYQPIRTEKYKQKNYLPILNFLIRGLKMCVAIVLWPNCLFSHYKYLDSSLLVFFSMVQSLSQLQQQSIMPILMRLCYDTLLPCPAMENLAAFFQYTRHSYNATCTTVCLHRHVLKIQLYPTLKHYYYH